MKFALIYISPNGTTEKTTKILENVIKNNHQVETINIGIDLFRENHDLIIEAIKSSDIVGFGSPIYHMDILKPMQEILEEIMKNGKEYNYKFKAFIYLNYAGITSGKAFINTIKFLKKINVPVIGGIKVKAPHFNHNEKFPDDNAKKIIAKFYNEIELNKFQELEWRRVKKIFSPEKKLVNILYPFIHLIAKKRRLPICINISKCKKCQKCVKECPVGAIDENKNIDFSKCIHCYHCVATCPFNAVESPLEKFDEMIKKNKKIIGMENPANKIFI